MLGLWIGPTAAKAPSIWATVLTEIKNRGVADVFIVCCDCDDDRVLLRAAA